MNIVYGADNFYSEICIHLYFRRKMRYSFKAWRLVAYWLGDGLAV